MDGYHGGEMARICCAYVENPDREEVVAPRAFAVVKGGRAE
jgi:hypothetical protein